MAKILKLLFLGIIVFSLVLSSWYVINNDIEYTSEIARDFFLMQEITQKKVVLIGPSSTTGLFHGPLWLYVNYPAFLLGNGNPVFVGWNWILLVILFVVSGFFIAKKLFDTKTAYLFTLMISVYSVFHARGLYNPHGAMFIIPAFFLFFILYIQTLKLKYLIIHVLLAGALIQFQMAIGIPFLILSFLYISYVAFKNKKIKHIISYLLIILVLANFAIFDVRHEFILSKIALKFLTSAGRDSPDLISMLYQRIKFLTTGIEFLRSDAGYRNLGIFIAFMVFLFLQIRDGKYKKIYFSFLYFYFGYLVLSMLNSGGLLYFYIFPLFPFVFLIFSSFVTSRYKTIFMIIFFILLIFNIRNAINDNTNATENIIGKDEYSWAFMKNSAQKIFEGKEKEFGYFVFAPDTIGYRQKYALNYLQRISSKKTYYFQKKKVTYIFAAPHTHMKDTWWTNNELHITKKPENIINFENGYKIEKYLLTDKEINVKVEPNIDPGLTFR